MPKTSSAGVGFADGHLHGRMGLHVSHGQNHPQPDPESVNNNGLLGSYQTFWAITLHFSGVHVALYLWVVWDVLIRAIVNGLCKIYVYTYTSMKSQSAHATGDGVCLQIRLFCPQGRFSEGQVPMLVQPLSEFL